MKILIIDDDQDVINYMLRVFEKLGYKNAEGYTSPLEALDCLNNSTYDLVISDLKMPVMSGLEVLRRVKSLNRETYFILYSGRAEIETVVSAFRLGADDFYQKPINLDELNSTVIRLSKRIISEINRSVVSIKHQSKNFLFCNEKMKEIQETCYKLHKSSEIPVLITGETGVGKEVIAQLIHCGPDCVDKPFIALNCAAIPNSLFESELFGYESGTFTGGKAGGKKGKIDIAEGGTLFLDEIGDLPLESQAKLLRLLEEKEFYRVGGLKKHQINTRIICATNAELNKKIAEGTFRKDVFYRFFGANLEIPTLAERREDIIPLAEYFLKEYTNSEGKDFKNISEKAKALMLNYHWPGNIRELKSLIRWICFNYNDKQLLPKHLAKIMGQAKIDKEKLEKQTFNLHSLKIPERPFLLDTIINQIILEALKMYNGNRTKAAQHIGISRRALYWRLEKMQIK